MNKLIIDTLKLLGIPVSFMKYKGQEPTYITFFSYDGRPGLQADDREKQAKYYYQIDIWSKDDYTELVNNVRQALLNVGFLRINEFDLFEEDTGYYHKVLRVMNTKEVL